MDEIKYVKSMTSNAVILRFEQNASMHGISEVIVSDNGPPFNSRDFAQVAKGSVAVIITRRAPIFQKPNFEESAVKFAKKLLA